jgi:uncharacterized membrane protein
MTSRLIWQLSRVARRIWFRATLFSILAVLTALVAIVLSPWIPEDVPAKIGADAVDNILGIIASSMLTVTTFSLSTMVAAYSAATSNVTPRATRLVMEDTTTQNVLATFIGSFLFSLVGIVVLSTGAYGESGRVVLFIVTIAVIILIVITLLRWIDHLSSLGRVTETTERVEAATIEAMRSRRQRPCLGGQPFNAHEKAIPATARPIHCDQVGYVQHLDTGALSDLTNSGGRIYVISIPGSLVDPTKPIAWADGITDELQEARVRKCFTIADTRSFDQDPRFGASVLAEIASRALSPGINDPGTAIDVITRALRVLLVWSEPAEEVGTPYPNIFIPQIDLGDIYDDLFTPIARDGAGIVEIGLRLQKSFATLARIQEERYTVNARRHAREALDRAESALTLEADKVRLRAVFAQNFGDQGQSFPARDVETHNPQP